MMHMASISKVDQVLQKAASAVLGGLGLSRVLSEPAVDSEGRDALRITVVFAGSDVKNVSGDKALDAIVRIHQDLEKLGDVRVPIVDFATEAELKTDGRSQSR